MLTDDEMYQLQSNQAELIHLNAGITQISVNSTMAPVSTVPHGGQIGSLWDCNSGRIG